MQNLSDALSQAFRKMKATLFSPFSLSLWFTLAFPAFLANLGSGGFGFNFVQTTSKEKISDVLTEHFLLFLLLLALAVLASIVLYVVFCWLSSRGRFIFLDMLVRGADAERFGDRWSRFKTPANSFFQIKLGFFLFYFLCEVVGAAGLLPILGPLLNTVAGTELLPDLPYLNYTILPPDLQRWVLGICMILIFAALLGVLVLAILETLFNDYGALLMYREGISGWTALQNSLAAIRERPWRFVKYIWGLILIQILSALAIFAFLIVTCCCIGYILLLIPYLSTVVMMPIIYTRWQFILEYFGDSELLRSTERKAPAVEEGIDQFIIRPETESADR